MRKEGRPRRNPEEPSGSIIGVRVTSDELAWLRGYMIEQGLGTLSNAVREAALKTAMAGYTNTAGAVSPGKDGLIVPK